MKSKGLIIGMFQRGTEINLLVGLSVRLVITLVYIATLYVLVSNFCV